MRIILAVIHAVVALACFGAVAYSSLAASETDSPMVALLGAVLFAGMALAIWRRSKWVLLPGVLLIAVCLLATVAFSAAFVWPERAQNIAIGLSLGTAMFEGVAIFSVLAR